MVSRWAYPMQQRCVRASVMSMALSGSNERNTYNFFYLCVLSITYTDKYKGNTTSLFRKLDNVLLLSQETYTKKVVNYVPT